MKLKRYLSVLLALAMCLSVLMLWATAADAFTITSEDQLKPYFDDAVFRSIVFEAVKDGQNGAKGSDVLDALKNYYGEINARQQGIVSAKGLQYLRGASLVDLSKNKIEDWSFLEITGTKDEVENYYKFAGDPENNTDYGGTNVYWKIGGNPFKYLPSNFGGRLVIEQPATTASVYNEQFKPRIYMRGNEPDSQIFNITRCMIQEIDDNGNFVTDSSGKPVYRFVKPNASSSGHNLIAPVILKVDHFGDMNVRLPFHDVTKSGIQTIGIGIDEEIKYHTSDEYYTITPGSQSFKYYIHPQFYVYDTVKLSYVDGVVLKKTDEFGKPLAGAQYELRNKNGIVLGTYTTNDDGMLVVSEKLSIGTFSLVETAAPAGYGLDSTPQTFTIQNAVADVTLGGALTSVLTTKDEDVPDDSSGTYPRIIDGEIFSVSAEDAGKMVFIAGPSSGGADDPSPDITLTSKSGAASDFTAIVKYSALETQHDKDGNVTETKQDVLRSFDALDKAQNDVNAEKNANNIVGPVTIYIAEGGKNAITLTHTNKKTPSPGNNGEGPATVSVKVNKVWDDDSDSAGKQPKSVTVELYRDGVKLEGRTATLSAANSWRYTFSGLTKYSKGATPYEYTVRETAVEGYTAAIVKSTSGSTTSYTITNTLTPEPPQTTPPEPPAQPPVTPPAQPPATPPADPGAPGDPGAPEPPTTPGGTASIAPPSDPNLPQTSDSAPAALYTALLLASACGAFFFLRKASRLKE